MHLILRIVAPTQSTSHPDEIPMQPPSWQQHTPCFPIVKPSSSPILSQSETPVSSPHKLLLILGAFSVPNYLFPFFETSNPPIIIPLLHSLAILPHNPFKLICPTQLRPPPHRGQKKDHPCDWIRSSTSHPCTGIDIPEGFTSIGKVSSTSGKSQDRTAKR